MAGVGGGNARLGRTIVPQEEWIVPGNVWLTVFSFSWSFFVHLHRGFPQKFILDFNCNFSVSSYYCKAFHRSIQEVQKKHTMSFERPETPTYAENNTPQKKRMQNQARGTDLCYSATVRCPQSCCFEEWQGQVLVKFTGSKPSKGRETYVCLGCRGSLRRPFY